MTTLHAMPPKAAIESNAFGRIHAALTTTSIEQTQLAIAAVAQCLHACVGEMSFARLLAQLDNDLKPAFLAAAPDANQGKTGSSLVMAVAARLPRGFPAHGCLVVRVVLAELSHQAGPDATQRLLSEMPERLRKLWPTSVWKGLDVARAA